MRKLRALLVLTGILLTIAVSSCDTTESQNYDIVSGKSEELFLTDKEKKIIEANKERLLRDRSCEKCDLRGVNLEGARLFYAYLRGANLFGAKFNGAELI